MKTSTFSIQSVGEEDDFEMLKRTVMDLPGVVDVDIISYTCCILNEFYLLL